MKLSVEHLSIIPALLSFFAVALFVYCTTPEEDTVSEGLNFGVQARRREQRGIFLKIFGGVIQRFSVLFAAIPMEKSREKLRVKLIQAGSPGGLNPDEFNAARVVAVVLLTMAGAFIDNEVALTPILSVTAFFLGVIYPDIWLKDLILWRKRRIFRDLPDFLDTLRLAVDAGLDLSSALKVTVEKGRPGPLLDEMELVERDIALGRTRKEGFRNFADRLGMTEINGFVLALIQADQLGASIGPILKIQAEVARTKRWQLAEVLVNKMPMKMLGPLVVFIFPASFVILFTPLFIQYMQTT